MKLTEIYKSKKQVLSFEIFPPKKDADNSGKEDENLRLKRRKDRK